MGACNSACKGKVGASTPAVRSEAKADTTAESTIMQPIKAGCDQPEDAKRAVEVAADAAGETQADTKAVANDDAPVLEGADAWRAFGWCCAPAPVVQPESTADANVESNEMQLVEAACDQPEHAKRIVEVAADAAGETQADTKEVANDGAPVLEGADAGKAFGWCCAPAPVVQPESTADANVESNEMQLVEAACDQPEHAQRIVEVAADAAGETQADSKEVANDGAPVLEGADAGKAFGWCCASAPAVQPDSTADANAGSTEMQLVEAACDQTEDANRAVEVAADAAGEMPDDAKEPVAGGAPVLEGADAGKAFGWCCQVESASRG